MSIQSEIVKRLMESKHLPDGISVEDVRLTETVIIGGNWYWKSKGVCYTQPTDKSKPKQEISEEEYRDICAKAKSEESSPSESTTEKAVSSSKPRANSKYYKSKSGMSLSKLYDNDSNRERSAKELGKLLDRFSHDGYSVGYRTGVDDADEFMISNAKGDSGYFYVRPDYYEDDAYQVTILQKGENGSYKGEGNRFGGFKTAQGIASFLEDYRDDIIEGSSLEEAKFVSGGSTYACVFGRYTKDGEPISQSEYWSASEKYRKEQGISTQGMTLDQRIKYADNPNALKKKLGKQKRKDATPDMKYKRNGRYANSNIKKKQLAAGSKFYKNLHPSDTQPIIGAEGKQVGKSVEFQDAMSRVEFEKAMSFMGGMKNAAGQWETYDANDNSVIFSRDEETGKLTMMQYNYDIHNK